jgi:hypothetical protein
LRATLLAVLGTVMLAGMFGHFTTQAEAQTTDLTKPFAVDKETVCLFHLDDVAAGEVKDAVEGGKAGKAVEAKEAEGKFGKALAADGSKGWVDVAGLPKMEDLTALTVECWVKFNDRPAGDVLCRGGQYMIRASETVHAYFSVDGAWRIVKGTWTLPAGKWTHIAITWDGATKKESIFINGVADTSVVPEGVTDGKLGGGEPLLRLGNHSWTSGAAMLDGQLDEVRVSSVVRKYQPLPGAEKALAAAGPRAAPERRDPGPAKPPVPRKFVYTWATSTDPTDAPKNHVENATEDKHEYTVAQGGTMDGLHCRTPMGCGMAREGAFYQTWESNRILRMENMGDTDVVNPWISNGRNNFRATDEIAASAIVPGMTDSEKAYAIWFQEIQHRHHSGGDNNELGDVVKVFNVYGYNTCGNDSMCIATLLSRIGIKAAPARALGHCISQAYTDGAWHFLDGDMHCVYLLRDNKTVASDVQIARDHDLVKRTHSEGILFDDTWWHGQGMPAMYFTETEITGSRMGYADTTMNMQLRPAEALVWRWGQWRPVKHHGMLMTAPTYEDVIYNGLWEYRPDLAKETWRKGAKSVEGVLQGPDGLTTEAGKPGTITWAMASPYVFVGGHIDVEGSGAKFSISQDGKSWTQVNGDMDRLFSAVGPPCYKYQVKCEFEPGAKLTKLAIVNDVQMAPFAMPDMQVGDNKFTYTDATKGPRNVRITHEWVERSATKPPADPEATYPKDGGDSAGTDVVFEWTTPADPDGDAIADYQFELSARPDLRTPLSMDFYKLTSRTSSATRIRDEATKQFVVTGVKSQYALSQPGLLTPDTKYYWHVKAKDAKGLWGPWSKTFSFTAHGAALPLDLTVDCDAATGSGKLKWKANPVGTKPAKYRVYASEEKGFTVADEPFQSTIGISKKEMGAWEPRFPANFVAETDGTEMVVIGPDAPKAANKVYYRVVAVDAKGKRSGPSDYTTAPRPVIYSKPMTTAKVGEKYQYEVCASRSLGDLTARMISNNQQGGYFDIEKPQFALVKGPAWLKIDAATGVLSGSPDAAGKYEVEVTATIDRKVRKLDESKLIWGNEKVQSETTERMGQSTQKFVIEVP